MKQWYKRVALVALIIANIHANVMDEVSRYGNLVFLAYSTTEGGSSTKQLINNFKSLSSLKPTYRNAGIFFLSSGQADMKGMDELGITKLPAVVIFKRGKVVEFGGERAILYGYSSLVELEDFVDHWLSDTVAQTPAVQYNDYNDSSDYSDYDDDYGGSTVNVYQTYDPYYGYGYPYYWGGYGWPGYGYGWGWRGRGGRYWRGGRGWSGRGGRGWSGRGGGRRAGGGRAGRGGGGRGGRGGRR